MQVRVWTRILAAIRPSGSAVQVPVPASSTNSQVARDPHQLAAQCYATHGIHGSGAANVMSFMIAVGLSIPAVALFAFGKVVGDVRIMRNHARMQSDHLQAMRSYYESNR
jgi:hypothetical protein